jgi:hypothetical protein
VSQRLCSLGSVLAQRSAGETLEAADSDVILNLTIPYRCVVLHEPAPESRQFPLGKAFDCRANLVNTAHEITVYLPLGYSGGAERYDVLQIDDGARLLVQTLRSPATSLCHHRLLAFIAMF